MTDLTPQLIGPRPRTTPVAGRKRATKLPPDLLAAASRRLGIISILLAVLWPAGTALHHVAGLTESGDLIWMRFGVLDLVACIVVVASIGIYVYTRGTNRAPEFVLDLGLVYMVLTAASVGLFINWRPLPVHASVFPMISPIGPIMLMFAAIAPNTPAKTATASLIAASMNPLAMLIARARGTWDFGPLYNAFLMHAPDFLLVPVAIAISHIVTRLGEHVATAREMGSYRLGELLGRGGMGEVYKATHRMLARPAAIKLIRQEMIAQGREGTVERFRREAQVAASLRSPHTVALYDFGVTDDQTFYLVMELLDGMDLELLVRRKGPLPAARVVHILRQVCESLEEAHAAGLVHRDIKPANIHLGTLGLLRDFVKVLDFGLVKSLGEPDTPLLATAPGFTVGTPAYMAPEMALGETVDGRADIYALGCVAYFLLSGQLVFEGVEAVQVLIKRLNEDPPRVSERTELPIPRELEQLVMACLSRNPNARPSAGELSRSLAVVPVRPWTQTDAAGWWQVNQA